MRRLNVACCVASLDACWSNCARAPFAVSASWPLCNLHVRSCNRFVLAVLFCSFSLFMQVFEISVIEMRSCGGKAVLL